MYHCCLQWDVLKIWSATSTTFGPKSKLWKPTSHRAPGLQRSTLGQMDWQNEPIGPYWLFYVPPHTKTQSSGRRSFLQCWPPTEWRYTQPQEWHQIEQCSEEKCCYPASFIVAPLEENMPQSGYVRDFQDNLRQAHQQVRQAMCSSDVVEKTYFGRRVKSYSFSVGQRVWLCWPRPLIRQRHRKLTRVWTGPWVIT